MFVTVLLHVAFVVAEHHATLAAKAVQHLLVYFVADPPGLLLIQVSCCDTSRVLRDGALAELDAPFLAVLFDILRLQTHAQ